MPTVVSAPHNGSSICWALLVYMFVAICLRLSEFPLGTLLDNV